MFRSSPGPSRTAQTAVAPARVITLARPAAIRFSHPIRSVTVRVADIPELANLCEHDQNATVVAAPPTDDDQFLDRADLDCLPHRTHGRVWHERDEASRYRRPIVGSGGSSSELTST